MNDNTYIPKEDARRRLDAMTRLFTKSDTVLSGSKIAVAVAESTMQAPSWTDGSTITFNRSMIGDVQSVEDVIRVLGLNHHELAHCLYTPRQGTKVVNHVITYGWNQTFNLLEDQRIETFLTAQYPSTIPYLISAFLRYCMSTENAWESNFVLMYGRRYLPKEIRQEFRARFKRPDLIPAFEQIIDQYRKVIFPADTDLAITLMGQFQALLNDMMRSGLDPTDPNGHSTGGRPAIDDGSPVSEQEQNEASQASDAFDQAFDADDDQDDDSDDDTGKGDSVDRDGDDDTDTDAGDGNGKSDGKDDGIDTDTDDGTGTGGGGDADSKDDDGTDDGDPGSSTAGGSQGADHTATDAPPAARSDSDLRDLLDSTCKAFEDLDDVKEEVADAQRAIVQGDGDISTSFDDGYFQDRPIGADDVQAARMFSRQLERLRSDADPGWNARQSSGRLNVKRYMEGDPVETLFDRWDEGHTEVADIECVVLVDTSGSMRSQIGTASRAMWTIKRAMETLDASVTVFSYDSTTKRVYDSHENVDRGTYRSLNVAGWTHARPGVEEALHVLSSTQRANRIFIVITDGRWDGELPTPEHPYSADELIEEMNRRNITTALAHIDRNGYYHIDDHRCSVATRIDSASDLVDFAKRIVTQTMKFSEVK
jgi:hypothetical protein